MKTNRGLEWYQSKAYDLPLFRWLFFFKFKGPSLFKNLQRSSTCRYNSNSGALQSAITVIAACRARLPHTFAAVSTLTGHSTTKCLLTLKTRFFFLKSEGPLN
jgi:hypothetical protein